MRGHVTLRDLGHASAPAAAMCMPVPLAMPGSGGVAGAVRSMLVWMTTDELRNKWNARYADSVGDAAPLDVLQENAHLLPASGDALDLACGLGGSALFLAQCGLSVHAWDLSPVAIERLRERSGDLQMHAMVRDVVMDPPERARFDVICIGHFLERGLCRAIAEALRPGGLLFYQTFSAERIDDSGPADGPFRLDTNELLRLFPDLTVRFYREEGRAGDVRKGFRNRAQLVAQQIG